MEVTKDNFQKAVEIFEKELESADFVSIDGEFSGLSTLRYKHPGYDTLESIYERTKVGTSRMLLLQYGISLFKWQQDEAHYEVFPFTFYVFPRPYKRWGNNINFTSQSSSLDFLATNDFDFNKLIHKGISYMNPYAEERARNQLERDLAEQIEKEKAHNIKAADDQPPGESKVFIPKDQREFMDSVCESVKTFVRNEELDTLDLPPCTPFQRKLIYEKIEELYPLGLYLASVTDDKDQKFIRCNKTLTGYKKNLEEKCKKETELLESCIGFSKVMKMLSASKKPLVGHNMFLDLFLTITSFFGDPPPTMIEFKEKISKLFPTVIDTKHIASSPPISNVLSNTSVQSLVNEIDNENLPDPNTVISERITAEGNVKEQYHDAGYDAYCTGRIFISLVRQLLPKKKKKNSINAIDFSCDELSNITNFVYIMGIRDVKCTDLCKQDPIPNRRNVYYVRHPSGWSPKDVKELFLPICQIEDHVNRINDESAFITVRDESKYEVIFKKLVDTSINDGEVQVLPYNFYLRNEDPRRPENREPRNNSARGQQRSEDTRSEQQSAEELPAKRRRKSSDVEDGELSSDD